MMKIVKNRCKKCGYSEEYTQKQLIKKNLISFIQTILICFGIILIILMFIIKPSTILGSLTSYNMNNLNKEETLNLREYTANITKKCIGDDSNCYAIKVYEEIKNIRYIPANNKYPILSTKRILKEGGDCKNTAGAYVSLLRSIGIKSYVSCSIKEKHCIAVVPEYIFGKTKGNKIVVDLTIPTIRLLNKTTKEWEYYEKGKKINGMWH